MDEPLTTVKPAGPHSTTLVILSTAECVGRVRGYQFAFPYGFTPGIGIDSYYMEGVSLTHGRSGSRTHIWTFISGLAEVYDGRFGTLFCPCVTATAVRPPAFVGNDYFCESGLNAAYNGLAIFYPNDPLWDGQNCVSSCCRFNNPPYFTKTLPAPTSDNIELRICSRKIAQRSDTPIDQVELYVQ